MFAVPQIIQLNNGLRIACDEYGDPGGRAGLLLPRLARLTKAGRRLRPGSARARPADHLAGSARASAFPAAQPGRTLRDWPPLVAELARRLAIDTFRVLAVSGGGPYAMATAWALPEQVQAAAIVSGAPPLANGVSSGELHYIYDWLISFKRRFPALVYRLFNAARPFVDAPPAALAGRALPARRLEGRWRSARLRRRLRRLL